MFTVGLTGGITCGESAVANILHKLAMSVQFPINEKDAVLQKLEERYDHERK